MTWPDAGGSVSVPTENESFVCPECSFYDISQIGRAERAPDLGLREMWGCPICLETWYVHYDAVRVEMLGQEEHDLGQAAGGRS